MIDLLITIVIISIIILVHELGHFIVAKLVGVKVEEFGIGYPPRLWGKKIKETIYSINALPFGGFVRLFGEEEHDKKKVSEQKHAFYSKNRWQKSLIIIAGVVGNSLLGVL